MGWMIHEIEKAMTELRKRQKELFAALQEAHKTETAEAWYGVQNICDDIDDAVADVRTLANRECAHADARSFFLSPIVNGPRRRS
jgi:hypothetical protein